MEIKKRRGQTSRYNYTTMLDQTTEESCELKSHPQINREKNKSNNALIKRKQQQHVNK